MSNVNGSIKVFGVESGKISPQLSLALPEANAPKRKAEIPAGLALSPDGKTLYVCANLSNGLLEMDSNSGKVLRRLETGALPYDVLLLNGKAYVSNWGGRVADEKSTTGPAGRGSVVRVDPIRHIASEGSLSILDLKSGKAQEILTGKHASALALSPDKNYLVVANAGEDTLSVLDTRTDKIVETVSLREDDLFGSSPDALTFSPDGERLFVALGSRNCVAQIAFRAGRSRLMGKIPTGWFPGALAYDENRKMLHVANIKGAGSGHPVAAGAPVKYNSHQYFGTLSLIPLPTTQQLAHLTGVVDWNTRRAMTSVAKMAARPNQPPRPIPSVSASLRFSNTLFISSKKTALTIRFWAMSKKATATNRCAFLAKMSRPISIKSRAILLC